MTEPSAEARVTAFKILARHPDCLRDDTVMNDLIDDIAGAIDAARTNGAATRDFGFTAVRKCSSTPQPQGAKP